MELSGGRLGFHFPGVMQVAQVDVAFRAFDPLEHAECGEDPPFLAVAPDIRAHLRGVRSVKEARVERGMGRRRVTLRVGAFELRLELLGTGSQRLVQPSSRRAHKLAGRSLFFLGELADLAVGQAQRRLLTGVGDAGSLQLFKVGGSGNRGQRLLDGGANGSLVQRMRHSGGLRGLSPQCGFRHVCSYLLILYAGVSSAHEQVPRIRYGSASGARHIGHVSAQTV